MRLKHNPNAEEILQKSNKVIKKFPFILKGNEIIELGMGKGKMITTFATMNPHMFYIGIEKSATISEKALKKSNQLDLKNFLIINEDISKIDQFFKGQAQTIWLTFSDPWPKVRHEKRRLTYKYFLNLYKKLIKKNGTIKLKTDNDIFFQYSIDSFLENNWKLKNVTNDFHNSSFSKDNIKTEYELKWSQKGKKINYLEAKII